MDKSSCDMFRLNENNKTKYVILNDFVIEEQNLEIVELNHVKTNAKIVLFVCDDDNRVFNIAFKTPVNNSKGTPHILEHSVLCGSKKYNVKDPFIELAKGSMNTFLNAMTFPDKTCYPVASANLKDFHNLVDVYLDAVFYPNAVKNDKIFKQEGWHYEISNLEDNLKVNGVVYNEMRGVYSDPDSILESAILKNLFNDTNYAYDYGGKPDEIYNLSFDEFIKFHETYYSPSNAIVYFYGNLDFNYELDYLDREYLQHFEKRNVDIAFKTVTTFKKNNEQIDYYSIDSEDNKDKAYIAYSFALDGEKSELKNIVMQIINYVLFASDSAILKEKFLNEGLGEVVFSRYDTGIKSGFYSVISQNITEAKKDKFIKLFDDSIQNIIKNGLDIDKFKAAINSCYFDYAEGEYSRIPRGIYLSLLSLDSYLYDENVALYIEYQKAFDLINAIDLNDKNNLFIETLKEVFVDNNHRCVNVLRPKLNYSLEKDKALSDELEKRKKAMSNTEINKLVKDMNELKEYQSTKDNEEALKCIPSIKISDIDRDKKSIEYVVESNENVDTIVTYKNDRDIVYISLKFDITDLSKEELYLFSIINNTLSKVDLISESFHDFNNFIDIHTGGLNLSMDVTEKKVLFSYSIKVAKDKIKYAFDIFYKLFSEAQFIDTKRINILLNESRQNSLLAILSGGHRSAINRSKSTFDFLSAITDKVSPDGIGFYKFTSAICNNYSNNADVINDSLDLLYKKLHRKKMYLFLCTNKNYHDDIIKNFKDFIGNIIKVKMKHIYTERDENRLVANIKAIDEFVHFDDCEKKYKNEAILTPNDINFCAIAGQFPKEMYSGRLSVLRTLFNYEYLWTNIRVLGGAYGCMATFSDVGNYALCSYRDPNVSNTNKIYFGVPKFLKEFNKSDEEIKKYVIGSMGTYDNPLSVVDNHKRNIIAYFDDITDEEYNKRRHDVLDINLNEIRELSEIFKDIENGYKCALISNSKLEEAKKEYDIVWQLIE